MVPRRLSRGVFGKRVGGLDGQWVCPGAPGGGALRYQMATHCQTAGRSGSGERENIGAVNSFEAKKGGRSNSD